MPTLNWIGKEKVVTHHQDVPFRVLDKKYTFGDTPDSGNMIIHGDNLEALKALLPKYEGKIKCIYIDPPYNTGNEGWVYNDNVNDPHIRRWLGQVVGSELDDLTRHDKWLCMMYPRLVLLQKLLADDGAIFISIDDNEVANLRLICDEIFGKGNFVACIANVNNPKGRSDQEYIATAHEYIVAYRKSSLLTTKGFKAEEHITKRYNKTDKEGRKWREIDLRKTGSNDLRTDRPNMYYPFYWDKETKTLSLEEIPNLITIFPMKDADNQGCWRWERKTAAENISRLYARYMPNKKQWSVFEMDYFDENDWIKPISAWTFKDVNSERGTEMFVKYLGFPKDAFQNPKPVGTIERILQIASDKDSIILDSFAGSGTTAHAVLNLNKQDGGHRKFILVELGDYAETITAERVRRVIGGYGEGSKSVEGTGGSFSFYELGAPLFLGENLNEGIGTDKLREYIWYSETRAPYAPDKNPENAYHLGNYNNIGYYFYYEREEITTLNKAFLNTITVRADQYIIYADNCLLSDAFMRTNNIVFKKIPRDIRKF